MPATGGIHIAHRYTFHTNKPLTDEEGQDQAVRVVCVVSYVYMCTYTYMHMVYSTVCGTTGNTCNSPPQY